MHTDIRLAGLEMVDRHLQSDCHQLTTQQHANLVTLLHREVF